MSEPQEQRQELSAEDREFMIDKLAEILVLDYYHVHDVTTDGEQPRKRGQPKPMKGGSYGTTR